MRKSPPHSPARPRRHRAPREAHHAAQRGTDETVARHSAPEAQTGGGGASGRGPVDDDGFGKRPDRGGGDGETRSLLLIVLGILAMGAGVLSARMLADSRRKRSTLFS